MKKKIIFVTKALWIGGIETALVNLLNHFNYDKYDVTLLVLKAELNMLKQIHPKCRVLIADRDETVSFQEKYRYSRLYHLTEEPANPSRLHKMMMWTVPLIRWVENRFYIRYIRKMMQGERFDTTVIYSDVAGETAVRAIRADKYLMFYHHGAMRHVYHDIIAYKKCEKIIAVSENQAKKLKEFIPAFANKVFVIHNLVDVAGILEKSNSIVSETFDSSKFHIVTVGRIAKEKGIDLAVFACAELVKKGVSGIQWWIVGGGPEAENIRDMIKQLNLEEYICMTDMKDNPYPYMKRSNLYVQPSRIEGYPMTILEAMILGKVVISTDNPGAREIITNDKMGVLCNCSPKAIADMIMRLMIDKKFFVEIENNIQTIDFDKMNKKCINILDKIL